MCTVGERGSCVLLQLQAEDIAEVSPDVIGPQLEDLRQHINQCEAEFSRRLQRFDKGEGYSADGARSASGRQQGLRAPVRAPERDLRWDLPARRSAGC